MMMMLMMLTMMMMMYRMKMVPHTQPQAGCRKNCKFNPRCFIGLGEKFWLEADDEDEDSDGEIEDDLIRVDGVPAGLRNLGNTCYVNSFLQVVMTQGDM